MATLVKRKEIMLYYNTTPGQETKTWKLYGKKTVSCSYDYNPSSTSETYITDDNATTILDAYAVSIPGDMKCYYGDAVFDYINQLRYNLAVGSDAEGEVLLIDRYIKVGQDTNAFQAEVFKSTTMINNYGGDGGKIPNITFTTSLNGDPEKGSVTFTGEEPTFTQTVV